MELLNRDQVRGVLGVSISSIVRLEKSGELPAIRIGKLVRYRKEDVAGLLRTSTDSFEGSGPEIWPMILAGMTKEEMSARLERACVDECPDLILDRAFAEAFEMPVAVLRAWAMNFLGGPKPMTVGNGRVLYRKHKVLEWFDRLGKAGLTSEEALVVELTGGKVAVKGLEAERK